MKNQSKKKKKPQNDVTPPQSENTTVVKQISASYSGPIPPPNVLAQYAEIDPGFADRIVTSFEKEANHRRKLEEKVVNAEIAAHAKGFSERRWDKYARWLLECLLSVAPRGPRQTDLR